MTTFFVARFMGWLEKLRLLFLYLPLSSSLCFIGTTDLAISATPATTLSQNQEDQRLQDRLTTPVERAVSRHTLPHLTRSSTSRPPLAPFPSFNSQQLDQQLQRYLRFLAWYGQPDILIVGSSRALQGIDPIVLQQTFASRGYPTLKIFNFGVNGATAQLVDLILRKLLTPNQLPRLLLWADGVRAFNGGRIDITYNRAIASPGYQLLTAGIRPVLPPTESPQRTQPCTAFSPQLSTHAAIQPKSFNFVPSFDWLKRRQWCWESLKTLSQPDLVKSDRTTNRLQEMTGFQSLANQFKPDEYFQRYPRVRGEYDADYRNFTLNGQQTDALNTIMAFAKARQIPVVFVNMPLTQIYLDETRTANEKQFRAYLKLFARSQLHVHDLSQRWLNQNTYFIDPSHLNRYGAAAVAAQLGNVLTPPSASP